jgi:uncharacterized protein (TIGR02646 family)
MHRLHRDPQAPVCLGRYHHGQHRWSTQSPTSHERTEVWDKLNTMQGDRCAYCEVAINANNRHIEHFRQRRSYPQATFAWSNLFGSCNRAGTCGDHKDKCGHYDHNVLIKPDQEDPDDFFVFAPDGNISPKANLRPDMHHRATETIRILNLQGALTQIRKEVVRGYLDTVEAFAEMADTYPSDEWLVLLEEEVATTSHLPYATAIRHVLSRVSA